MADSNALKKMKDDDLVACTSCGYVIWRNILREGLCWICAYRNIKTTNTDDDETHNNKEPNIAKVSQKCKFCNVPAEPHREVCSLHEDCFPCRKCDFPCRFGDNGCIMCRSDKAQQQGTDDMIDCNSCNDFVRRSQLFEGVCMHCNAAERLRIPTFRPSERSQVRIGGVYRKLRGALYRVITVAQNTESVNEEWLVIYKNALIEDSESYATSLDMFLGRTDRGARRFAFKKDPEWMCVYAGCKQNAITRKGFCSSHATLFKGLIMIDD